MKEVNKFDIKALANKFNWSSNNNKTVNIKNDKNEYIMDNI